MYPLQKIIVFLFENMGMFCYVIFITPLNDSLQSGN